MKLSEELKNKFQDSLINEKTSFYDEVMRLYDYSLNNPIYHAFLYGRLSRGFPHMFEEEYALNLINSTFSFKENPFLDWTFRFKLKGIEEFFNLETNDLFNLNYDLILKKSFTEFVSDEKLFKKIKDINNFSAFLDLVIDNENNGVQKFLFKYNQQIFNIEGWSEYVKELIQYVYDDFEFDKSKSNHIFRFVKKLNDTYSIGLEYNNRELIYQWKKNNLCLPNINIIIFTTEFKKTIKYNRLENSAIWNLESFSNPFFSLHSSLMGFYARVTYKDSLEEMYRGLGIAKIQKLENNKYRIYNSDEFGELLKTFAFYEFYTSSLYNKPYISYIEKSFMNLLKR